MSSRTEDNNGEVEILIVEDSPVQAECLRKLLVKKDYRVMMARNGAEGLDIVRRKKPHLVVSDILMPEMDGFQMCREIKQDERVQDVPVILLTALTETEDIIRGLECQADNFVTKPYDEHYLLKRIDHILSNRGLRGSRRIDIGLEMQFGGKTHMINSDRRQILDLLFSTFEAAVQNNHELTKIRHDLETLNAQLEERVMERTKELLASEEQLKYLAHYDVLTDLPNRILFMDRLTQVISRAPWLKRTVAVLFIDLDHFKWVNDTLGHSVGDGLLKAVANRLSESVRKGDTVARIGGDEFTVILADIGQVHDAPKVTRKIIHAFSSPFVIEGHELFITPSVGTALFPDDGEDAETLLKKADAAMYFAKGKGRNNYQHFSPDMSTKFSERLDLENTLRKALDRDELLMYYQPQIDLQTGALVGMEALLRWKHPEMGRLSPAKFIPVAEETGLIIPVGEWVFQTSCIQNRAWQEAEFPPVRMAVNLSLRQFRHPQLKETLNRVLRDTGLDPKYLELEITESSMQNVEAASSVLGKLRSMGLTVSVDDFGIGYFSLGHLKRFPVDKLKIDQSFVRDIMTNPDAATVVTAIITLAHSLNLKVIAEGVETREQLEFLKHQRCDEAQGYFFSPPMPAEGAEEFLKRGQIFC